MQVQTQFDPVVPKVLAIDFDSTCVTNEYPSVGSDIGAVPVLKELVSEGHKLVLFTMRTGKELKEAYNWFIDNAIELYGVQRCPDQVSFTDDPQILHNTPKPRVDAFIDDRNIGVPLVYRLGLEPFVDWVQLRRILKSKGYL